MCQDQASKGKAMLEAKKQQKGREKVRIRATGHVADISTLGIQVVVVMGRIALMRTSGTEPTEKSCEYHL